MALVVGRIDLCRQASKRWPQIGGGCRFERSPWAVTLVSSTAKHGGGHLRSCGRSANPCAGVPAIALATL